MNDSKSKIFRNLLQKLIEPIEYFTILIQFIKKSFNDLKMRFLQAIN